ncbi:MAG: carboxypeptidase regulatory-like domain-containing protein, partial [Acidobacteriota bacterium]
MRLTRVLVAGCLLFLPALAFGQAQGRVKGEVTDQKGNPIEGAKIVITCPDISSYKKEVTTDKKGVFSTLIVDATKQYLFHVEAPGFQGVERIHKPLIGGQTLEIEFRLNTVKEAQAAAEPPGITALREGRDLIDAGKKVEARAKFEEAVTADAKLHLGWLELSLIDFEAGSHEKALTEAQKCLEANPDYAACLAAAANAARGKGDEALFEQYMAAYKVANPSDPAVLYNEAVAHLNKNDDAKAKPLLEQALEADPGYPDALYQLGMVCLREGNNARAKE